VEDAGFEIRDTIDWVYSTGFPKSHDLANNIDKQAGLIGDLGRARNVAGKGDREDIILGKGGGGELSLRSDYGFVYDPKAPESKEWSGWGTALKPAHEPILVARKPLIGTVVENVLKFGTGALNVDATRVGSPPGKPWGGVHANRGKFDWDQNDPLVPAPDANTAGRWPPNLVLTHSPECRQEGTKTIKPNAHYPINGPADVISQHRIYGGGHGLKTYIREGFRPESEEVESWVCVDSCPVAEMDRQSGDRPVSGSAKNGRPALGDDYGAGNVVFPPGLGNRQGVLHNDEGGASRFFPSFSWHTEEVSFIYSPKASRSEREAGLESMEARNFGQSGGAQNALAAGEETYIQEDNIGLNRIKKVKNHHPTVKPIALLRWLTRLVTPPGGTVLDPFAGSGSEGCAAVIEGFNYIGIEKEPEYAEIARKRMAYWKTVPRSQAPTNLLASTKKPSVTLASFEAE